MKRRNFVQNTTVGVVGYNVLQPILEPLSLLGTEPVHQWLERLCSATGTTKRVSGVFISPKLHESVQLVNAACASQGYLSAGSGYRFYGQHENTCLYVLEFCHSDSGITDLLIPVLHENADGSWHHFKTINSFELEALSRAAEALQEYAVPLQDVLLPAFISSGHLRHGVFPNKHGEIEVISRLTLDEGVKTNINVSFSGHIVFKETFISRHCLKYIPSLV